MSESLRLFVTGAASGIGRAAVGRLCRAGHHVIAADINEVGLHEVARADGWLSERVSPRQLDVADGHAFAQLFEQSVAELGHIDVCMNVAGILEPGWIADLDPGPVDRQVDVNIKGVMHGTRLAAAHMSARGQGHIVNVASMAALAPIPGISVYSATKYAVRAFSLCAALELEPKGVAVSVICPDAVDTPMLDLQEDYEEAAVTFSNDSVLTADGVARVMTEEVLRRRPLEVPLPRSRGWLAKLANAAPRGSALLLPIMQRRGRAHQRRRRADPSRRDR